MSPLQISAAEVAALMDRADAPFYRRPGTVTARRLEEKVEWTSRNGSLLTGEPGDWLVTSGSRTRTVKPDIFAATYRCMAPGVYVKTALVRLLRMPHSFTVDSLEGPSHGSAGDYLALGPGGDAWAISAGSVSQHFEQVSS